MFESLPNDGPTETYLGCLTRAPATGRNVQLERAQGLPKRITETLTDQRNGRSELVINTCAA